VNPFNHIFQDLSMALLARGGVMTKQAFAICCNAIF